MGGHLGFSGGWGEGGVRSNTESTTLFYLATRFLPFSMCGVMWGGIEW